DVERLGIGARVDESARIQAQLGLQPRKRPDRREHVDVRAVGQKWRVDVADPIADVDEPAEGNPAARVDASAKVVLGLLKGDAVVALHTAVDAGIEIDGPGE